MKTDKYLAYAGIGSRDTPEEAREAMRHLGTNLAKRGYVLRSGGAPGADTAFEEGAKLALGQREIYLPWKGFQGRTPEEDEACLVMVRQAWKAARFTSYYHPKAHALSTQAQLFMNRNAHQVMGADLANPVEFVLFWSRGVTRDSDGVNADASGGTGQAVRIAYGYNIPTFHVGIKEQTDEFKKRFL